MLHAYIQKKAGHYNLSEMSIVLGIFAVMAALPAAAVGSLVHSVLGAPTKTAVIIGIALWSGSIFWLWVSFIRIGRQSSNFRTSTFELTILQVVCVIPALALAQRNRLADETVLGMFTGLLLLFQFCYFTLAWGIGARLPARTYILLAVTIGALAPVRF